MAEYSDGQLVSVVTLPASQLWHQRRAGGAGRVGKDEDKRLARSTQAVEGDHLLGEAAAGEGGSLCTDGQPCRLLCLLLQPNPCFSQAALYALNAQQEPAVLAQRLELLAGVIVGALLRPKTTRKPATSASKIVR